MTDLELMQQARDALVYLWDGCPADKALVERLDDRLAQPEPEPVAYMDMYGQVYNPDELNGDLRIKYEMKIEGAPTPLYCAPPQREWKGLTDEEIENCFEMSMFGTCRAIEAKLKEKNNG